ncbi:histidine phosphatase family protein [Fodinisporobacter ferrooxydans]|uniref:phosphoglycerate mutase (2,3-diphosphoglycerate-dependent) n=1 Tax=Fodinisporobacter ferrooxydans TaxID=2901836 RepID=A0ABY4CRD6_9BACL|nr:histidine phosphatase family protein [Alicyclobacillaceae bacterium MYW30-H2]
MTTIYLLRHGQTVWNEQGDRFCGTADVELTAKGIQQAKRAANQLKDISLDAIFHSGLVRSRQTAQEIFHVQEAAGYHPLFERFDAFQEVGFGDWEGLTKPEVHQQYGDLYEAWVQSPAETAIPGGEDLQDSQSRAFQKLQELSMKYKGGKLAIVAHNTINRLMFMAILKAPINSYRTIIQSNACLNILEWVSDDTFKIQGVNLT